MLFPVVQASVTQGATAGPSLGHSGHPPPTLAEADRLPPPLQRCCIHFEGAVPPPAGTGAAGAGATATASAGATATAKVPPTLPAPGSPPLLPLPSGCWSRRLCHHRGALAGSHCSQRGRHVPERGGGVLSLPAQAPVYRQMRDRLRDRTSRHTQNDPLLRGSVTLHYLGISWEMTGPSGKQIPGKRNSCSRSLYIFPTSLHPMGRQ